MYISFFGKCRGNFSWNGIQKDICILVFKIPWGGGEIKGPRDDNRPWASRNVNPGLNPGLASLQVSLLYI
jgi:hypothetical protein